MPLSAIATGLVDLTLPAAEMPGRLFTLNGGAQQMRPVNENAVDDRRVEEADFSTIQEMLTLVRQHTGHDFSQYKRPTLLRRIARRLKVHDLPDASSYLGFLRSNDAEIAALMHDLTITVTNFFRDHEAYESLEHEVVPKLFEGKSSDDQVRAWVVGCATGEEAYSVAILLSEYASRLESPPKIGVFATDIDEAGLAEARAGRYIRTIGIDVSPERLRKYFVPEDAWYRVRKELRELILFAPHNVLRDPPFSRLDLVTCRNLLIYLNREAQERVLATLHFSLLPNGYLFLGASESAESAPSLFLSANEHHHIYRNRPVTTALPTPPTQAQPGRASVLRVPRAVPNFARPGAPGELHQQIVERLAPPSCLADANYEIVHMSEHAGRYFRMPGGEPEHNLLRVIRPELRLDLQVLLLAAKNNPGATMAAESRRVQLEIDGKPCTVELHVRRVTEDPAQGTGFFLVVFDEIAVPATDQLDAPSRELALVGRLEEELQRTRDSLHLTVEQYETSTEELRASNEELQAINEELQSATEELETSKEELESVNEELITVNQELRQNIGELSRANSDLKNLLSATDLGIIFLGADLSIKLFTARAQELFNITSADIGRPLQHFTSKLNYPELAADARTVLQTLQSSEREVMSSDGRWYLARLMPYRTLEDKIDGAVLNLVDITEHLHAIELRRQAAVMQEQRQIFNLANVFICGLDDRIIFWNTVCEELFGYTREEALGRIASELLATEFPEPVEAIRAHLLDKGSWEGELVRTTRSGERVTVASRWVLHRKESGEPSAILKIFHDVTARKRAEDELRAAEQNKDKFLATLSHELRNPLAAILSSLELLREAQSEKEAVQFAYGVMDRQFGNLMRLVDDLLDVARLGQGKIALQKQRVTLAEAIDAALETVGPLLEPHRRSLEISVPPTPIYVDADRGRLSQVISNLLHNAAKYTPASGRIELSAAVKDGNAVLRVRDNGVGIAPEVLPSIFEFYAQGPATSESNRRGLGVGLALARQLVELHGGTIEAKSGGRGQGSEFIVRLPLAANQSSNIPLTDGKAGAATTIAQKVLVIDDERDIADALAILLRQSGHQVWTAYSGSSGIEAAVAHQPTAALVDLSMPGLDGYEVARQLRERLPNMLLIALSGLVRESDRQRAREAGFARHVAKPVNVAEIEALLRR